MHVNPPTEYICGSGGGPRPPIEPSNFRFLRQDSPCIRVYMFAIPTRKRAYIVYLPVMHAHRRTHVRIACMCVSTDVTRRRSLGAILTFTLRGRTLRCVYGGRRRTEGRVARKVNLLSLTCARFYVKKTDTVRTTDVECPESSAATFCFVPKSLELAFACIRPLCHGEWRGGRPTREMRICCVCDRTCDAWPRAHALACISHKARSRNPPRLAIIIKLQETVDRGTLESSQLWNRCLGRSRFIPLFLKPFFARSS